MQQWRQVSHQAQASQATLLQRVRQLTSEAQSCLTTAAQKEQDAARIAIEAAPAAGLPWDVVAAEQRQARGLLAAAEQLRTRAAGLGSDAERARAEMEAARLRGHQADTYPKLLLAQVTTMDSDPMDKQAVFEQAMDDVLDTTDCSGAIPPCLKTMT